VLAIKHVAISETTGRAGEATAAANLGHQGSGLRFATNSNYKKTQKETREQATVLERSIKKSNQTDECGTTSPQICVCLFGHFCIRPTWQPNVNKNQSFQNERFMHYDSGS
jgi:hypothetical protein